MFVRMMVHVSCITLVVLVDVTLLFLGVSGPMHLIIIFEFNSPFRRLIYLILQGLLGLPVGESCIFEG